MRLLQSAKMQVEARYQAGTRAASRRVRRTVKRIDPWSVLKVSLLFYVSLMLVLLFAAMLLYVVASSAGAISTLEGFVRGTGWPDFRIRAAQVFRVLVLVGIANAVAWSAVNVFLAFLYNLVSDVVGGIEITMTEREQ